MQQNKTQVISHYNQRLILNQFLMLITIAGSKFKFYTQFSKFRLIREKNAFFCGFCDKNRRNQDYSVMIVLNETRSYNNHLAKRKSQKS